MAAPAAQAPGRLARWAHVLSVRTISGKLIIGLVVLFGLATVVISVVTAQSLSNSLMSSLRAQVQSATGTWFNCVTSSSHGPGGGTPGGGRDGYARCYSSGQAPGTFLAILSADGTAEQCYDVSRQCTLTAADQATLAGLRSTSRPSPSAASPPPAPPPDPQTSTETLTSLGTEFMFTKVPGPDGTTLVTGLPLSTVNQTLGHVQDTEHALFAVALGLAVILGAALVQFSLRPLRRVAATATQVTELPLDSGEVTLPAGVPDTDPRTEVGQVGAAFNRMLAARRAGPEPPRGQRGPAAPVRRRRLTRAADSAVGHPRLRRVRPPPPRPGARGRAPRAHPGPVGVGPDERPGR